MSSFDMNCKWSKDLLKTMQNLNNFIYSDDSSRNSCLSFYINNCKVGIVTSKFAEVLKAYPDVFTFCNDKTTSTEHVSLNDKYLTFDERTHAMEKVLKDMVKKESHISLRGWRNEYYEVAADPTSESLMKMERAAVSMFGIKTYGSHMNGYVNHPSNGMCLWIARRSKHKATFPGMLDNMVAGGKGFGVGIRETMIKECHEEAGIPQELAEKVVSVGMISYIYEDNRGIQRDVEYCFDLELPVDFIPKPVDGEVEEFKLCTINEVKDLIIRDDFKPNCAGVTLDFLIRKGFVLPDEVPDYVEIVQLLHHPL